MVREAAEHPGMGLLREDYPVAICTDDPLIFNTTLSRESEIVLGCVGPGVGAGGVAGAGLEWVRGIHERALGYALGPVE